MAVSSISRPGKTEDISNLYTITKSSGAATVTDYSVYRSGNVIFGSITCTTSAQTAAGIVIFSGTLAGGPCPVTSAIVGFGRYGSAIASVRIDADGTIGIVAHAVAFPAQSGILFSFMFVTG